MSAVVGVLNESLTESIKGFYKLRKAYMTLDGVLEAETRYMAINNGTGHGTPRKKSFDSLRSNRSARSMKAMPGGYEKEKTTGLPQHEANQSVHELKLNKVDATDHIPSAEKGELLDNGDDDDEFFDADENLENIPASTTYAGNIEVIDAKEKLTRLTINQEKIQDPELLPSPRTLPAREGMLDHDPDSDIFANPIDVFIHSGANLCFGLLLLMISMIPPAFGKLLLIIGFRGDRDRGLRMLWQASKFHNINGAMAGLILLGYYNTIVGFSDILPDPVSSNGHEAVDGYPQKRCEALLVDMRLRHPKSHLWLLEEARMQALNRQLAAAVSLPQNSSKSSLKQVEALDVFERSLYAMYMHDYNLCATSFLACVSLNNWSHALYYYIAGSAHVELYRHYKKTSPRAASIHAKKATDLLRTAPQHAGKKKFMARQLPFDVFVTRKLQKWEHRAAEWKVDLIDAVGVSPIEEMVFFWNGYKRMDPSQLAASLAALAWSENPSSNPTWLREGADERAVLAVLRAATLRNLARWDDATEVLQQGVLSVDRTELKGGFRDDWTAPVAHYEMGVISWMRRRDGGAIGEDGNGSGRGNGKGGGEGKEARKGEAYWVRECEAWVDKAARWEGYVLDARIGLKLATAQDTLRKWRDQNSGAT